MSFKKLVILRVFAMDYHSGQNSRGYKILSMTHLRLLKMHSDRYKNDPIGFDSLIKSARRTKLYKDLVEKYGDKI